MPRIECYVTIKDTVNVIEAHVNALIVSPAKRFLYLESACPSDSGAHQLMACISDDNGSRDWRFYLPGQKSMYSTLTQPAAGKCSDWAREIPGFSRKLHHVAIVETAGELILAPDNEWLWQKLRSVMSCPTLPEWGKDVMRYILDEGLLIKCESIGIDEKLTPYVLAEDASPRFDTIIGAHVRKIGGIPKRRVEANDKRVA